MNGAYLRVSSRSQDVEMQRAAIQRAARTRGDLLSAWYAEQADSTGVRPELQRLRADVAQGMLAKVYVYRLDRLSRGGICETLNLISELRSGGVQVITIADGFALGGPADEIVMAVLAWAAQMERAAIQERIAAARVRVEAAGGDWGRPRRVDAATQLVIQRLAKEGRTVRSIAMAVKVPKSTVDAVVSEKGAYERDLRKHPKMRKC
jgi:DNA invertase Pin-like site-specific DNA recombinase